MYTRGYKGGDGRWVYLAKTLFTRAMTMVKVKDSICGQDLVVHRRTGIVAGPRTSRTITDEHNNPVTYTIDSAVYNSPTFFSL